MRGVIWYVYVICGMCSVCGMYVDGVCMWHVCEWHICMYGV